MRWAICRARTQVKVWTRMLCSVQWRIGLKETTRGSLSCRKENSASDWGAVAGDDLGGGPVIMIGDQHVLAEELFFQGGTGGLVDVPGQAQVAGLLAVQLPGHHPPHPGLADDRGDLGFRFFAGPGVLPRARVAASSSSFLPALAKVVPSNPRAWLWCSSGE